MNAQKESCQSTIQCRILYESNSLLCPYLAKGNFYKRFYYRNLPRKNNFGMKVISGLLTLTNLVAEVGYR